MVQWIRQGDDWYFQPDGFDVANVETAVAWFRIGGQWRSITLDVATYNGVPFIHLNTTADPLPNGTEILFYLTGTYIGGATYRFPTTGSISTIVYP